jgi:L-threonylcarbamoyladenylate synthase
MLRFPQYVVTALQQGGVGVIPTDTIYGVAGSAMQPKVVERIYRLRQRDLQKPFIVLIPSIAALQQFGVRLDEYRRAFLNEAWPGPVSIILPTILKKYRYLHRGKNSLAFRMPAPSELRALLRKTGPLVVPSANPAGKTPATTIKKAQEYFGSEADFYMDVGRLSGKASTLIDMTGKEPVILRK